MLRGLGRAAVESILAERGEVEIGCDFCGVLYRFDAVDVGDVFHTGGAAAGGVDERELTLACGRNLLSLSY